MPLRVVHPETQELVRGRAGGDIRFRPRSVQRRCPRSEQRAAFGAECRWLCLVVSRRVRSTTRLVPVEPHLGDVPRRRARRFIVTVLPVGTRTSGRCRFYRHRSRHIHRRGSIQPLHSPNHRANGSAGKARSSIRSLKSGRLRRVSSEDSLLNPPCRARSRLLRRRSPSSRDRRRQPGRRGNRPVRTALPANASAVLHTTPTPCERQ